MCAVEDFILGWQQVQEIRVREEVIISFDMTNEVLISTPLPSIINNCDKLHWSYAVAYKGSLAFITIIVHSFDREFNVWVLGEYGVVESWTKLFSVRTNETELPLGLRNNSLQLLVLQTRKILDEEQNLLVLFDPITKQRNCFPNFEPGKKVLQLGITFTESLVPISW